MHGIFDVRFGMKRRIGMNWFTVITVTAVWAALWWGVGATIANGQVPVAW